MGQFKKQLKWYFLIFLAVICGLVWYAVFRESRSELTVYVLDIGQGDAIFIEAPNGNQILIDGGPNGKILEELGNIMPFYDRTIDTLILTHPHEDHLNGLIEVLKKYKVSAVLESGNNGKTSAYDVFQKLIKENGARHFYVKRGTKLNIAQSLQLNILLPIFNLQNGGIHNQMVVGKLIYGKTSFMLTGDMEKNLENYLVVLEKENFHPTSDDPKGQKIKSDVLKVSHHGSKTSTSEIFLGWVSPKYAVISAGEKNKYGHPNKEVLDRLEKFGAQIFRTDLNGLIKIKSDGQNIEIKN